MGSYTAFLSGGTTYRLSDEDGWNASAKYMTLTVCNSGNTSFTYSGSTTLASIGLEVWHVGAESAYSKIAQTASAIRSEVASAESGLRSSIEQTASAIRSEVASADYATKSYVQQTASSISLKVDDLEGDIEDVQEYAEGLDSDTRSKLLATGIDITNRRIDMTADNFTLTNNSGELTLGVDESGNMKVSGKISAATYDYKMYFVGEQSISDVSSPADADYVIASTANNTSISLGNVSDHPLKLITIINPAKRTQDRYLQIEANDNIVPFASSTGGSQYFYIGLSRMVKVWADTKRGVWRVIEQDLY